jgi:hypothetical protein
MPGPFRTKIMALAVKSETTEGVDSVPAIGTDAVRFLGNPTLKIVDKETGVRKNLIFGGFGTASSKAVSKQRVGTLTVRLELRGNGLASLAYADSTKFLEARALHLACGNAVAYASNKATFTDVSGSNGTTCTMYVWDGANLYKLVGCVGSWSFEALVGQVPTLTYAMQGTVTSVAAAAISGLVLNTVAPQLFDDVSVIANGTGLFSTFGTAQGLMCRKIAYAQNAKISDRPAAGTTGSLLYRAIVDTDPMLDMEIEFPDPAAQDFFGAAVLAWPNALAAGPTQGNVTFGAGSGLLETFVFGQWFFAAPDPMDMGGLLGAKLTGPLGAGSITGSIGSGATTALQYA